MFRSFRDTDRFYGLRSKVGYGSTGSSPSGSPRVFTKVVEGALTPLREVGVRILNYLDDWLILAQSREQLGDHRDLVHRHFSQLGLRVNWEKSKLSPVQRIFALSQFLPVYWVSNGREELAGVTLAAPFPLTRGYERPFLPQFSSPDGEPWWNPPSTRSSLTPGPVLVLARPGLRSAPVLG